MVFILLLRDDYRNKHQAILQPKMYKITPAVVIFEHNLRNIC